MEADKFSSQHNLTHVSLHICAIQDALLTGCEYTIQSLVYLIDIKISIE